MTLRSEINLDEINKRINQMAKESNLQKISEELNQNNNIQQQKLKCL